MTLAFTRFDLTSWAFKKQTLLLLAFIALIGIVLPIPGMAIAASALVTSLILSAPFLGDERDRLDTLYGVLPISRSTVVVGRALSVLLFGLAAVAVATAVTFVMAWVRNRELAPELLIVSYAAAFAIVGLAVGVQLPVLFRVGYTRGRFMVYVPVIVIAGGAWVGQAAGILGDQTFSALPLEGVVAACAAIGVIGITVGTGLAVRFYGARELR
ncbi:hypothetical protein C5B85_13610 [Pseudoclavibacter sp. AY1F1]|uniref:ABC-2 transporter permease n=1 Tax=Pseudoclavibacter sp. AY1F1 TaxID=2080583 RepID=UPI000CE73455|nr:ABC-2 transporter permease [Pseudoclavibacter sp. AY1F1]PPF43357.1 hypothetical protein C5B85_13610 [Pseudoclavibacter sp. AY1F1]